MPVRKPGAPVAPWALARPLPHRQAAALAVPAIASNIAVPLAGLVDTAVLGHFAQAVDLGRLAGLLTEGGHRRGCGNAAPERWARVPSRARHEQRMRRDQT